MKPHIYIRAGEWRCQVRGEWEVGLGMTPVLAFNHWVAVVCRYTTFF